MHGIIFSILDQEQNIHGLFGSVKQSIDFPLGLLYGFIILVLLQIFFPPLPIQPMSFLDRKPIILQEHVFFSLW